MEITARKMIKIIILFIIAILIIILLIEKINSSLQFKKDVTELFSRSKNISNRTFNHGQISDLPEPVQRYFRHILKEGHPYISYVRLKHNGQFKTSLKTDWMNIEGEQYFTTEKPGFIWKGKTSIFTARDMYLSDKGRLVVTLLSLFNIVDGQGESFNQGELLRWLGESVWFPTNLLPSANLQWMPIDDKSSKLTFDYKGLSLYFIVSFNENNEITQVETKRFMEAERLESWVGKFFDYKDINGVVIPTVITATWKLKEGDHNYVNFHVKEIEYNKPEKY
jgi:hypothetical protein